jgi:hypothetical protein
MLTKLRIKLRQLYFKDTQFANLMKSLKKQLRKQATLLFPLKESLMRKKDFLQDSSK